VVATPPSVREAVASVVPVPPSHTVLRLSLDIRVRGQRRSNQRGEGVGGGGGEVGQ
jgi:hypothetical protein